MLKIVQNDLSPEDNYEVLDAHLTELLVKSGADVSNEVCIGILITYNRQLRIALGLPVEVAS